MNETEEESHRREMNEAEDERRRNGMDEAERENRRNGMNEAEGEVRQGGMSRAEGEVRQSGMSGAEGEIRQSGMSGAEGEVRQSGMSRAEGEIRQSGMSTAERNDHRGRISDIEASENDRWGNGKGGQYAVNRQKENEDKMNSKWEARQESAGNGRREKTGIQRADAGKPVKLLEDKWLQLCAIYPHIHPFRDKREYLSIGPADFVLFPAASYKLVNNSFLLHGYYNYHHLILTRLEQKGEYRYYIGVPGSYFEKEKQVAIMFGFESFECESEPAQIGDFGYYMMRTEL